MDSVKQVLDSNLVRTILAVIAIAVSISIYFLNRKKKALSYAIVRNAKLFEIDEGLKSKVQVTVDGKVVTDVVLVIIDVLNSGNEPIKKEDFDRPVSFTFEGDSEVISARILGSKPPNLGAQLRITSTDVSLEPLLLNRSDGMSIELIFDKSPKKINVGCRIVGVPELKNISNTSNILFMRRGYLVGILSAVLSFILAEALSLIPVVGPIAILIASGIGASAYWRLKRSSQNPG